MGASSGGARGGYQRRNARRRSSAGVMSEINVTPLVDVMLVLLIVFMVAAPLMTVGVPIDLPKTDAKPLNSQVEPLSVSIKPDGSIFLIDQPMTIEELTTKLQALYGIDPEKEIRVRGDGDAGDDALHVTAVVEQGGEARPRLLVHPVAFVEHADTPGDHRRDQGRCVVGDLARFGKHGSHEQVFRTCVGRALVDVKRLLAQFCRGHREGRFADTRRADQTR